MQLLSITKYPEKVQRETLSQAHDGYKFQLTSGSGNHFSNGESSQICIQYSKIVNQLSAPCGKRGKRQAAIRNLTNLPAPAKIK